MKWWAIKSDVFHLKLTFQKKRRCVAESVAWIIADIKRNYENYDIFTRFWSILTRTASVLLFIVRLHSALLDSGVANGRCPPYRINRKDKYANDARDSSCGHGWYREGGGGGGWNANRPKYPNSAVSFPFERDKNSRQRARAHSRPPVRRLRRAASADTRSVVERQRPDRRPLFSLIVTNRFFPAMASRRISIDYSRPADSGAENIFRTNGQSKARATTATGTDRDVTDERRGMGRRVPFGSGRMDANGRVVSGGGREERFFTDTPPKPRDQFSSGPRKRL